MFAELRMIRWIWDHKKLDGIKNGMIGGMVGLALVEVQDKVREARFEWLEHNKRGSIDVLLRSCVRFDFLECRRALGQPKKNWNEVKK